MVLAAANAVAAAVSAAMGVIGRVHNNAADGWANAFVAAAAGFADLDVLVLFVADNAEAGSAVFVN